MIFLFALDLIHLYHFSNQTFVIYLTVSKSNSSLLIDTLNQSFFVAKFLENLFVLYWNILKSHATSLWVSELVWQVCHEHRNIGMVMIMVLLSSGQLHALLITPTHITLPFHYNRETILSQAGLICNTKIR